MKNIPAKLALLFTFMFVFIPGVLVSKNLSHLGENNFVNFSVVFTLLLFGFMVLETLRKISLNEQIDFNQNKIDIIQSSFILMDGNDPITRDEEEGISVYDNIEFNYMRSPKQNDYNKSP